MAVFNEILAGRYNRALQKLFGMKGPPPVPQLGSEILPVFNVFSGAENRYLEGWNRYMISQTQPAVAAVVSGIRFRNPTTSGIVAIFEKITVLNVAPANADQPAIQNGATTADLNLIVNLSTSRVDPRGSGSPSLIGSRSNTVSAPNLPNIGLSVAYAATPATIDIILNENQEITLLPGDAIQLGSSAVNLQLAMSVLWRERVLEDSEKT